MKRFLLVFAIFVFSFSSAQAEAFVLTVRETGNSRFDSGFVEGQILSALTSSGWTVVPREMVNSTKNTSSLKVLISSNTRRTSRSSSSGYSGRGVGSESRSRITNAYGALTISATILTKEGWSGSVAVSLEDSKNFTEWSESNLRIRGSRYSFPGRNTNPEQVEFQLKNNLLRQAIPSLVGKLNTLAIPKPKVNECEISDAYSNMPLMQMKIRLSREDINKYSHLGFVEVCRDGKRIRYKIVKIKDDVITIEFKGDPINKTDKLI